MTRTMLFLFLACEHGVGDTCMYRWTSESSVQSSPAPAQPSPAQKVCVTAMWNFHNGSLLLALSGCYPRCPMLAWKGDMTTWVLAVSQQDDIQMDRQHGTAPVGLAGRVWHLQNGRDIRTHRLPQPAKRIACLANLEGSTQTRVPVPVIVEWMGIESWHVGTD